MQFGHEVEGFRVTRKSRLVEQKGKVICVINGKLTTPVLRVCPKCGSVMHVNAHHILRFQDIELLNHLAIIAVDVIRSRCPYCNHTEQQKIPFASEGHRITRRLERRVRIRLNNGAKNTEVSSSLHIHPSVVLEIDRKRLREIVERRLLGFPKRIGIDEFLLHDGHRYATVAVDLDTGDVLFLEAEKNKLRSSSE